MATKFSPGNDARIKGKKSAKKPKRNISAFHIFSKEMHTLLNHSAEKVNPNNRMALISQKWTDLPVAEKNVYVEKAKLDKWRYLNELNEYLSSGASTIESTTKTKPKKFGNAFTYFLREKKEQLHEEHPELSMSEIMSLVAQEWRGLTTAAKQKYVDASEEDRERYKKEVCDMALKAKTATKSQSRKKLIKNAKNLEKTKNDLIQYSAALNNRGMDFVKKEEYIPYQEEFANSDAFVMYLSESSHKESFDDWVPKIEEGDNSIYTVEKNQFVIPDEDFDNIVLPKFKDVENAESCMFMEQANNTSSNQGGFMDLFHPEPKRNLLISKASDFFPQLSTFSLNIEKSKDERNSKANYDNTNNSVAIKRNESPAKGRSFLNGVLSNALSSDFTPFNFSELIGTDCSLITEQSFDRIFS